ncbi:hypothetical protein AVEN_191223-1 [Araneus ventricosus]|uniref:Uncharacterized protein n=1 Tax=Araneus ventricosus TaxID=182803 RepID=A0A4Y2VVU7_ARAVE|nr:hypothetical protein AVEN_191223-1 [Araneus ventricosus]
MMMVMQSCSVMKNHGGLNIFYRFSLVLSCTVLKYILFLVFEPLVRIHLFSCPSSISTPLAGGVVILIYFAVIACRSPGRVNLELSISVYTYGQTALVIPSATSRISVINNSQLVHGTHYYNLAFNKPACSAIFQWNPVSRLLQTRRNLGAIYRVETHLLVSH